MPEQGLIREKTLFVQRVNPPWVIEVKYLQRDKPGIRRLYMINGNQGNYVSLNLIDAN